MSAFGLIRSGVAQGARPFERYLLTAEAWAQLPAALVAEPSLALLGMWAEPGAVHAAFLDEESGAVLLASAPAEGGRYPALSPARPGAIRFERMIHDLWALAAEGAVDDRPWLDHGRWPVAGPMSGNPSPRPGAEPPQPEFLPVEGEGIHVIPVGPIHAGVIEPGHFRFHIQGECVVRLEARLGYKHKGIEKRFESMTLGEGVALAGRVSGDSTVAFAWAYAMAVEQLSGAAIPPRAAALRAMLLERERVANHLGDLGALGNDAGFAFGLAQFSRLKEDWLRLNARFWGHRYLMDRIVPGGLTDDLDDAHLPVLARQVNDLADEVARLRRIYDDHAGLQDRLRDCGIVSNDLAQRLGLTGLAARASGMAVDLRVGCAAAPYDGLDVRCVTRTEGDVAARTAVRFDEVAESLRLIGLLAETLPDGPTRVAVPSARQGACGIGRVEGWRGEVMVFVEAGSDERIRRCHPHDPSWQNWPLLEHAILGNIVPDFPLINKSFNLSYSGVDL